MRLPSRGGLAILLVAAVAIASFTDRDRSSTVPAERVEAGAEPAGRPGAGGDLHPQTGLNGLALGPGGLTVTGTTAPAGVSSNRPTPRGAVLDGTVTTVAPPATTSGATSGPATDAGPTDGTGGAAAATTSGTGATGSPAAVPPAAAPTVRLAAGQDAQRVVDAAPEGAVIVLGSGVHQRFSVQPRTGQFFLAEPGAVLDGGGVLAHAFYAVRDGHSIPDSVVISGASRDARLEIRNYTTGQLQTGAVHPHVDTRPSLGMGRNWVVQWCDIHSNGASGIRTADGMVIRENVIHHNGQLGVGGTGVGITVVGNEIAYNRTRDDVDPTWEGGGLKLVSTTGARVQGNLVYGNRGSGLWTDIDAVGTVTVGNTVVGNELAGIFDEISYGAEIRDNVVRGNGTVDSGWYWNAGIQIAASRNVVVTGNQLSGNRQGILLIQQPRGGGSQGTYVLDNIVVEGNVIADSGVTGAVRDTFAYDTFAAAIAFRANTYTGSSAGNFVWDDTELDAAAWQAVGFS
ncbi:MAG: right-handed parallel beta-helix repeat-containing protein [Acidimicrobiia bacterium]